MNDGYMDAAAVPVPDAGDDVLRTEMARTLSRTATERGYRLLDERYPLIDALLPLIRDHVASIRRHDPRCLSLTDSENNIYCDCRTLATIDGAKAATERAEKAEAAIERHGECICNTGPGTDGPEEFCPWHGRPYNDALDYMGEIIKSERTRAEGLHDASMRRQLRMIRTLEDALGIDPDDADACVPGCDEGAGGLEHDLHHLIERDAARGAAIERARAVLGDAHEVIDRGGIRREAYIPADRVRAALDDQEATDGGAP